MRSARLLSPICLLLALTAALASPASAEDYAVHLDRSTPVGHRDFVTGWHLSERVTTVHVNGGDHTQQDTALDRFVVTTEVLAVGARGNVLRAAITVHKLTHEEDGKVTEVLAAGARVIASLDGDTRVFAAGGKRLSKEVSDALKPVANLHPDGGVNEDETFGSSARHAIGDSWDANREAMVRDSGPELTVLPQNVTGTAHLVGLRSLDGTPCLEVREEIAVREAEMTSRETPDRKMKIRGMSGVSNKIVPVDGSLGVAAERTQFDMTVAIAADTASGAAMTGEARIRDTQFLEIAPAVAAAQVRH